MEKTTESLSSPLATDTDDLANMRATMVAFEQAGVAALGPAPASVQEYWTMITLPDGFESRTLVILPNAASEGGPPPRRPLVVLFHGGGFAIGTPAMVVQPGRALTERYGAVVVAPAYRLAPENAWPAPPHCAWDLLAFLAEHAGREFGASLDDGFVVGGFSAGGGLAATCAGVAMLPPGHGLLGGFDNRLARPITGVFANCPMLLTEQMVPAEYKDIWTSRVENKDAPALTSEFVERIWRVVNPDFDSPWTSPFNGWLKSAASPAAEIPHYIQVGRLDSLRDDGLILHKALSARGISTRLDVFKDDGHSGWTALPAPTLSKEPTWEEGTMAGMAWLLKRS